MLNNIAQSTMGTDSEEDFDHLFEDMDLTSSKLGKTENAKNELIVKVLAHLDKIDFKLELIHRDEVNVAYILKLLAKLKRAEETEIQKQKKTIIDLLSGEIVLRSKCELIEKFIEENLPYIEDVDIIPDEFEKYWRDPIRDEVFKCLDNRPSVLEAREIGERIIMKAFVEVFVHGMAA